MKLILTSKNEDFETLIDEEVLEAFGHITLVLNRSTGVSAPYVTYKVTENGVVQNYRLHRVIYEKFIGKIPEGTVIDHRDGNSLNNQVSNLRAVSTSQNNTNRKTTSKYVGVQSSGVPQHPSRRQWKAQVPHFISKTSNTVHLGSFFTELEAARCISEYCNINHLLVREWAQ